jgi:hypothetical protein
MIKKKRMSPLFGETQMSYDLELVDPVTKEVLTLDAPHFMRGGTYCVSGEERCHFNITYNYARHYYRIFPVKPHTEPKEEYLKEKVKEGNGLGIRYIYGLTGAESIPVLKEAISKLGDEVDSDYWKPAEGNAKKALMQLLALAQMRPDGVWDGD